MVSIDTGSPLPRATTPRTCCDMARTLARRHGPAAAAAVAGAGVVVGLPGFEPGTSASRTQRSTKLSHSPFRPEERRVRLSDAQRGSGGRRGLRAVLKALAAQQRVHRLA